MSTTVTFRLSDADMNAIADIVAAKIQKMIPSLESVIQSVISTEDELINSKDVQRILKISPTTFYERLKKGAIPPGQNMGNQGAQRKVLRWRRSEIMKLVKGEQTCDSIEKSGVSGNG